MNSLAFHIALPDRAVRITFDPPLSGASYERLLVLAQSVTGYEELASQLRRLAPIWGVVEFSIEVDTH